ncbi:hypothetical protein A3A64_04895 [Candidatus Gottesmanbacteria bacterium RIFCSPLOWO2_01_FULL_48_11]|uniref:Uncharacterized protein n=3 Tax=Candidatus Gottesmaniibacteriota TaxID=1752720 RepID=A0A1F6AT11_9BACT|nr:MAG: hypothetical protein UT57_C0008G0005 [Microgenomates group bacterium GW2011_GWC1_39_7]OGG27835.1 MAG: hypothetical protein A3A64_04895 [Candidatus Gottesmanbacteria bacterium RIFCSPLOWO2_01_FULL_48_11]
MNEYRKMFELMTEENKELFSNFKEIHDEYALNPPEWQKLFNEYGSEIMDVVRDYERRLCAKQTRGNYGKFSAKLSEKFWDEVRSVFPKINFVGVKTGG